LVLSNNGLTSTIPTELGLLTDLITLSLNGNELSGDIPAVLGNLVELGTFQRHYAFVRR